MRKHLIEAPQEVLVDGCVNSNSNKATPLLQGDVGRNLHVITTESNLMAMRRLAFQVSVDLKPFGC